MVACVLAIGCAGQRESTRAPAASPHARCTLRVSDHGTFADGEPMSRDEAVAHCKRAPGGVVVVTDYTDEAKSDLDAIKKTLEREGVRVYVRGKICYEPERLGCRPRAAPKRFQPPRRLTTKP